MGRAPMPFHWVDHTAELELHVEAVDDAGVFADAVAALAELLGDDHEDAGDGEPVDVDLALSAPDRAALLAAWLDELVFRAERDGLVPQEVTALTLRADGLDARVRARRGAPRPLIKGVTYHRLAFEREGEAVRACVVLDV
jgi:SHS2 domain-containing protein